MNSFIYDGDSKKLQTILDLHYKGEKVLCYKCGAELLIILSKKEKQKYKKPSGIYCPVDESHIRQWIASAEDRIDFRKLFGPPAWEKDDDEKK